MINKITVLSAVISVILSFSSAYVIPNQSSFKSLSYSDLSSAQQSSNIQASTVQLQVRAPYYRLARRDSESIPGKIATRHTNSDKVHKDQYSEIDELVGGGGGGGGRINFKPT
ncbi:hypothetical protein BY996DRAFT_7550351 [Phakopsora pachyrhizi]|uniref:Secreted protein n=1 Tax=Phakopsora pachyrhizi TaxID=170000 RepID=A0AAV0B5E4_PHAPC|nr:hypothetical protein BY996DRAFT_8046971 [Phakopsora pachyrhizi]KAI8448810.1 hypothetical protein BY996DRAFT_7550351 [Phakopsora pachyrhizi]CAH7677600.1 hypothetical protein PPACK8108_LOCUS12772 [Phakopsora pachyrhizi]